MTQGVSPVSQRNNISISGKGTQPMLFAHGYGCDQTMWRFVTPAFADQYKIVLFDHVGAGRSDLSAYDRAKYRSLHGYADDIVDICTELKLTDVIFVGHSVSAMIGILAANKRPELFDRLILIGPSPCYIDSGNYVGGFTREQIHELLDFQDSNFLGWSSTLAPMVMGTPDRPELVQELTNSFCRTDPEIAKQFAAVTFLSDNRADLDRLRVPALILQCQQDAIAGVTVGQYVHQHLPASELMILDATGHCPHLSSPEQTIAAMKAYLDR